MTLLLDTSTLVAAMIVAHPAHARCLPWLQRVRDGTHTGFVAAHSLAELYRVLTALPTQPRLSGALARQLIRTNVLDYFQVIALTVRDYEEVIDHLAGLGIVG